MPSRNRDTDVENNHMDTKGGKEEGGSGGRGGEGRGRGGMNWEIGIDMCTLTCIK